jgi:hypothetical protein
MANPFDKATDEELVEVIRNSVQSLSNQLSEAERRNICVEIDMVTRETKPGIRTPGFRMTSAWKQLAKPLIYTP